MLLSLVTYIPVLISVAYLTLAERKVLGYSQLRKGPNVVGIYGLLQPLGDGVKLFTKEMIIPNNVNIILYLLAPIVGLTLALILWLFIPLGSTNHIILNFNLGILIIFAISTINIYTILVSGLSSNSKYAYLGSIRAAAQMVSYEVCIGLIIINIILIVGSLNLITIIYVQKHCIMFLLPFLPVSIMFFISCLAETNRAPFDLAEGESEIVSGFNVEYSSMSFALFFLAEYSHIIFMSLLFSILFLGNSSIIKTIIITFLFIWCRTSFPRIRYNNLMQLLWKTFLPLTIFYIILSNSLLLILL